MPEVLHFSQKRPVYSTYASHYMAYSESSLMEMQQDAYARGRKDGAQDMQIELIKRGKALFQLAIQKAESITDALIEAATANGITVYDFHLKIEDWDKITSLIVVKLEDYVDDKIDKLYHRASEISTQYNDDSFHWNYMITYASDKLNREKILTDGFTHLYEHISQSH